MTKVQNFTALPQPLHAVVDGKPARCIAYGDVEGNSPSYLTIDTDGQSTWQSFKDVTIIDTNVLPLTAEALQRAAQMAGAGGSQQRTRQ